MLLLYGVVGFLARGEAAFHLFDDLFLEVAVDAGGQFTEVVGEGGELEALADVLKPQHLRPT